VETARGRSGDECLSTCPNDGDCSYTLAGPLTVMCFESDGLFCNPDDAPPKCRPIPAVGEACEHYAACGPNNVCYQNQVCQPPLPQECEIAPCHDELVCVDGACQPATKFEQTFACFGNFPDW
jgi:hypothetical protein